MAAFQEPDDDSLERFEAHGAPPLPASNESGWVEHEGAQIWYASHGSGEAVILLHGGLGHSGNWGYQVPALWQPDTAWWQSTAAVTAAARATRGRTSTN